MVIEPDAPARAARAGASGSEPEPSRLSLRRWWSGARRGIPGHGLAVQGAQGVSVASEARECQALPL